nr:hypothetical protein [uncultured Flavobacterium sp.]
MSEVFTYIFNQKINYKDLIRIMCSLLLLFKASALVLDDTYHIFFQHNNLSLFYDVINYAFSIVYVFAFLVMLLGIDLRNYLIYIVIIILVNIILTFQNVSHNLDLGVSAIIAFFALTIYIIGEGNLTIDNLVRD